MTKYTMDMVLEYAKVFEGNRDMGSDDNSAAKKAKKHNGQYVVNAYFTNEDDIEKITADGIDLKPLGHDRIKEGSSLGIGKYIKLSRMHDHVMTFKDKNGDDVDVDLGGPPKVVNLTEGPENKRYWLFDEDGALGNGTKAKVQWETYSNGAGTRLANIGVMEHVAFEGSAPSADDEMFMVD